MRFVHSWGWHPSNFLSDQIPNFLSAGIASLLILVFLNKSFFLIVLRARSLLNLHKISSFPKLRPNSAPGVISGGIVSSRGGHVVVGSRSLLSLSKIFPVRWTNKSSMFVNKIPLSFIAGWAWFVRIMIHNNILGWFTFVPQCVDWRFIQHLFPFGLVVRGSWSVFIIVNEFKTHWFFWSCLCYDILTVV